MDYTILLEYYRKKLKLSYKNMVFDDSRNFSICNIRTYKKLIANETIRNKDEIVTNLFIRVGRPLVETVHINYDRLSKYIEYGNKEAILEEIEEQIQQLIPYRYNAGYIHHYDGLNILKNYYKDKIYPNTEVAMEFLYLQHILDEKLISLLHIVFFHAFYQGRYSKKFSINSITAYPSTHLLTKVNLMTYYFDCNNYGKAHLYFARVVNSLEDDNVYAKVLFYPVAIELLKRMEDPFDRYTEELDQILFKKEIMVPDNTRNTALANLGINCILAKEYEKAISYFNKIINVVENRKIKLKIYDMFCKSQLGIKETYETNTIDLNINMTRIDQLLLKYFEDSKFDVKKKNKILLDLMRNHIDKYDVLYIFIIEQELLKSVSSTYGYKDVCDFYAIKCRL